MMPLWTALSWGLAGAVLGAIGCAFAFRGAGCEDCALWQERAQYWFDQSRGYKARARRAEAVVAEVLMEAKEEEAKRLARCELVGQIDAGTYRVPADVAPNVMRDLFPNSPKWNRALRPAMPKEKA